MSDKENSASCLLGSGKATVGGKESSRAVTCALCSADISHLSIGHRSIHVNRCLDSSAITGLAGVASKSPPKSFDGLRQRTAAHRLSAKGKTTKPVTKTTAKSKDISKTKPEKKIVSRNATRYSPLNPFEKNPEDDDFYGDYDMTDNMMNNSSCSSGSSSAGVVADGSNFSAVGGREQHEATIATTGGLEPRRARPANTSSRGRQQKQQHLVTFRNNDCMLLSSAADAGADTCSSLPAGITSDDKELFSLRMQLGEISARESELRLKKAHVLKALKKVSRKMARATAAAAAVTASTSMICDSDDQTNRTIITDDSAVAVESLLAKAVDMIFKKKSSGKTELLGTTAGIADTDITDIDPIEAAASASAATAEAAASLMRCPLWALAQHRHDFDHVSASSCVDVSKHATLGTTEAYEEDGRSERVLEEVYGEIILMDLSRDDDESRSRSSDNNDCTSGSSSSSGCSSRGGTSSSSSSASRSDMDGSLVYNHDDGDQDCISSSGDSDGYTAATAAAGDGDDFCSYGDDGKMSETTTAATSTNTNSSDSNDDGNRGSEVNDYPLSSSSSVLSQFVAAATDADVALLGERGRGGDNAADDDADDNDSKGEDHKRQRSSDRNIVGIDIRALLGRLCSVEEGSKLYDDEDKREAEEEKMAAETRNRSYKDRILVASDDDNIIIESIINAWVRRAKAREESGGSSHNLGKELNAIIADRLRAVLTVVRQAAAAAAPSSDVDDLRLSSSLLSSTCSTGKNDPHLGGTTYLPSSSPSFSSSSSSLSSISLSPLSSVRVLLRRLEHLLEVVAAGANESLSPVLFVGRALLDVTLSILSAVISRRRSQGESVDLESTNNSSSSLLETRQQQQQQNDYQPQVALLEVAPVPRHNSSHNPQEQQANTTRSKLRDNSGNDTAGACRAGALNHHENSESSEEKEHAVVHNHKRGRGENVAADADDVLTSSPRLKKRVEFRELDHRPHHYAGGLGNHNDDSAADFISTTVVASESAATVTSAATVMRAAGSTDATGDGRGSVVVKSLSADNRSPPPIAAAVLAPAAAPPAFTLNFNLALNIPPSPWVAATTSAAVQSPLLISDEQEEEVGEDRVMRSLSMVYGSSQGSTQQQQQQQQVDEGFPQNSRQRDINHRSSGASSCQNKYSSASSLSSSAGAADHASSQGSNIMMADSSHITAGSSCTAGTNEENSSPQSSISDAALPLLDTSIDNNDSTTTATTNSRTAASSSGALLQQSFCSIENTRIGIMEGGVSTLAIAPSSETEESGATGTSDISDDTWDYKQSKNATASSSGILNDQSRSSSSSRLLGIEINDTSNVTTMTMVNSKIGILEGGVSYVHDHNSSPSSSSSSSPSSGTGTTVPGGNDDLSTVAVDRSSVNNSSMGLSHHAGGGGLETSAVSLDSKIGLLEGGVSYLHNDHHSTSTPPSPPEEVPVALTGGSYDVRTGTGTGTTPLASTVHSTNNGTTITKIITSSSSSSVVRGSAMSTTGKKTRRRRTGQLGETPMNERLPQQSSSPMMQQEEGNAVDDYPYDDYPAYDDDFYYGDDDNYYHPMDGCMVYVADDYAAAGTHYSQEEEEGVEGRKEREQVQSRLPSSLSADNDRYNDIAAAVNDDDAAEYITAEGERSRGNNNSNKEEGVASSSGISFVLPTPSAKEDRKEKEKKLSSKSGTMEGNKKEVEVDLDLTQDDSSFSCYSNDDDDDDDFQADSGKSPPRDGGVKVPQVKVKDRDSDKYPLKNDKEEDDDAASVLSRSPYSQSWEPSPSPMVIKKTKKKAAYVPAVSTAAGARVKGGGSVSGSVHSAYLKTLARLHHTNSDNDGDDDVFEVKPRSSAVPIPSKVASSSTAATAALSVAAAASKSSLPTSSTAVTADGVDRRRREQSLHAIILPESRLQGACKPIAAATNHPITATTTTARGLATTSEAATVAAACAGDEEPSLSFSAIGLLSQLSSSSSFSIVPDQLPSQDSEASLQSTSQPQPQPQVRDAFDSEEEPNFAAYTLDELHKLGAQYGLKKDTKTKLVGMFQSMWRRLHGLPTFSQSQVAALSQRAGSRKDKNVSVPGAAPSQQKAKTKKSKSSTSSSSSDSTVVPLVKDSATVAQDAPQRVIAAATKTRPKSTKSKAGNSSTSVTATATATASAPLTTSVSAPAADTATATAATIDLTQRVSDYLRSHIDLFEQIISYKSIDLDILHSRMASDLGVSINKTALRDSLDSLSVFVSTGSQASVSVKRKQRQQQDLQQKNAKRINLSQRA